MRRVVTALTLVVAAVALAACSSAPTSSAPNPTTTAANSAPVAAAQAAASGSSGQPANANSSGDILSPVQVVAPGEMFPTDPASVPQAVLDNITAKMPMLVFVYDPTTNVAADERKEINAAISKYRGEIQLMTFNYRAGVVASTTTSLPPEVAKAELMVGLLKVNTTPYIVFVDRYGRVTYRFAGYVDRDLLEREVQRATE
jgi:hypothetical protein